MKLRTDLVLRHMGDEHVVIDPGQEVADMSKVYMLNDTAAFLWEKLRGKEFSAEAVANMLVLNYEVDASKASKDAIILVNIFKKHGLIV